MFGTDEVLCARQPIFNLKKEIYGYELLYRAKRSASVSIEDCKRATCELLINACTSVSDEELLVNHPLFFNASRSLLLAEPFMPVKKNTVIIEIQIPTIADEALTTVIYKLKRLGYRIALDGYDFEQKYDALLPLVTFLKIDVLAFDVRSYKKQLTLLRESGKVLVAKKVESNNELQLCAKLGFKLFQGFFLEKPQIIEGRKVHSNVNLALTIINELQQKEVSFQEISYLVAQDPKLGFQLLKLLNSPAQGLKREVSSLKQAVVFLGVSALKKWVILISLMQSSDEPQAFFTILLARARTCELIANSIQLKNADSYFMLGLFSGMDKILSMPMTDVVKELTLTEEMENALIERSGFMGKSLQKVQLLERADWPALSKVCAWSEGQVLSGLMEEARDWVEQLLSELG